MHAVFEHWIDDHDKTHNATELAAEFRVMTGQWADELPDAQPIPENEPFYLLASLKLGDPDARHWIETHASQFYDMWDEYSGTKNGGAEILIQYLLWYERDKPK